MNTGTHTSPTTPARASTAATVATTLGEVRIAIGADIVWCPDLTAPVTGVVAADLMSDVLVDSRPGYVLVTGLANVQVIRTATIADLAGVVFARGKTIPPDVLALAREARMPVFRCQRSLFETAGRLYAVVNGRTGNADGRPPA